MPSTTPKYNQKNVRTIVIQLCNDESCRYSPELHAHREDDDEKLSIELPEQVAQMVYGTPHPTVHNVPKN